VCEVKWILKQEKLGGPKLKIRYADYDWAVRGVFFQGHGIKVNDFDGCQLQKPAGMTIPSSPMDSKSLEMARMTV
jgi:hypothetical protein